MFDPVVFDTLSLALDEHDLMPASGAVLCLRAEPAPFLLTLPKDRLTCHNSFKPDHDALKSAGFDVLPPETEDFAPAALTIILPPRQRDEMRALFARALRDAPMGGVVIASLPNTLGAKTGEKILAELAGVTQALSKHKCRAFWAVKTEGWNAQLAEEWIAFDAPQETEDGLWSRPGLFSWDRIDAGSELLADSVPEWIRGRGADFGAGQGFLAREVLSNCPHVESMELYEAEFRALACQRLNLEGHDNWTQHWADATHDAPKAEYDFIVMNPPFHTGRADAASLGQNFIRAAADALKTGGTLWLVANRHLPYETVLSECFKAHEMLEDDGGYKIIRAEKPKRKR
ncbi:MAG: class I SAM-dependent methyltransferase [Hyphomonas sp.]|uniref:class I SAM-dependent methyltransferase n=1 Tax=Hyphomonas sp. TaxID=87 RepID=UPI003528D9E1